ncbi:hypothetical protein [Thauera linaloolentis]|uniref:hypothetical protein n=1 Tax=Thauera linaloolentis TaxID=76112 RepID=UPI000B32D61D|nr:hypothetical protein [Thauera linaloolentis]MCM8566588.1 hypothetical protein [Thauera linaloolentis]
MILKLMYSLIFSKKQRNTPGAWRDALVRPHRQPDENVTVRRSNALGPRRHSAAALAAGRI